MDDGRDEPPELPEWVAEEDGAVEEDETAEGHGAAEAEYGAEDGLPELERLRPSSASDSICFFCRKFCNQTMTLIKA